MKIYFNYEFSFHSFICSPCLHIWKHELHASVLPIVSLRRSVTLQNLELQFAFVSTQGTGKSVSVFPVVFFSRNLKFSVSVLSYQVFICKLIFVAQKELLLCLKSTAFMFSILNVSVYFFLEKQILETNLFQKTNNKLMRLCVAQFHL